MSTSICSAMRIASGIRGSSTLRPIDPPTSAKSDQEAYALLEAFGMPFSRENNPYVRTDAPTNGDAA